MLEIFPERLLHDLERVPGAAHSYLQQVCGPEGAELRRRLELLADRIGPPLQERAADMLGSVDNRRFFQGFAELVTAGLLTAGGWRVRSLLPPGPRLEVRGPAGEPVVLAVMAFLHQTRPGGDEDTRRRLVEELLKVRGRDRFVVHVRRWLPHDFDPTPVRRAAEIWLGRVAKGAWEGRYASYEDDHVALELALTGSKAKGRQPPLVDVLGPFVGHRALEVVEPRLVQELDRHNASSARQRPLVIAVVADQPWDLTPGYLRDLLYGRSQSHVGDPDDPRGPVWTWGRQSSVSVFRDPVYNHASGVLFVDRDPAEPERVRAHAWLNPWARVRLAPAGIPVRTFGEFGPRTDDVVTMGWHQPQAHAWEIG